MKIKIPENVSVQQDNGKVVFTIPENTIISELLIMPLDAKEVKVVYERNAQCDILHFALGDQQVKQKLIISLQGDGSGGNVLGVVSGQQQDIFDTNMCIEHIGKGTTCNVYVRGILTDEALARFEGLLYVEPGAKQTDTFLRSDFLLLSDHARAVAIPSLEIIENDLAGGGHAATVGKLDPMQLFYLQTRGITEQESRNLLMLGFLADVVGKIQNKEEKEHYKTLVEEHVLSIENKV